jgi:F0F1-type ATP synthase gamma subunit
MPNTVNEIDNEIGELGTLKSLVNVYGEIALSRMAAVRQTVLFSRLFLDEVTEVFADVQAAYLKQLQLAGSISRDKKVTVLSHNGQKVLVMVAANTRLYGDLTQKTYNAFMEEYRQGGVEATIIGRVGLTMFKEEMGERHQYTYFDYPDDRMDSQAINEIVKHLVQYEEIHLYYGKYKNVITQEPVRYVLSAGKPMGEVGYGSRNAYMFEPSLEEVMRFFEKEIFGSLFDQVIRESQLSKFAARLVAMDRADQQIGEREKKMRINRLAEMHQVANRKQLNTMPALLRVTRSIR